MADYAMFRRTTQSGIVILILYVDDMVITGSDSAAISFLKHYLQTEFEMKDLGFLRYFLNIEVAYSSRGYLLSQQKYISDILARATHHDSSVSDPASCNTPMELHSSFDMMTGHLFHILLATENLLGHLSILLLLVKTSCRQYRYSASSCTLPLLYTMLHCFEF